jgi:hypothetical protein
MIAPLLRMPSELHRKFGYFLVVPFVVVKIMSAIAITWIPLSSNRTEFVPEQDGYMQRVREAEERFGHPEPIVPVGCLPDKQRQSTAAHAAVRSDSVTFTGVRLYGDIRHITAGHRTVLFV